MRAVDPALGNPINVLLLSGDPAVAAALDGGGVRLHARLEDVTAAVRAAADERVDVCVVDAGAAGDTLLATAEITERLRLPVIVVSAEPSDAGFTDAVLAGASGYLPLGVAAGELQVGVREVAAGGTAIPRRYHRTLVDSLLTST